MTRSTWLFLVLLVGCADSTKPSEPNDSGSSGGDAAANAVCEPGRDQTCNDNPAISSLHGTCMPDGSCVCVDGVEKNPATGRCL